LAQQLIDKRGLAVINVRNDGDVTNLVHGTSSSKLRRANMVAHAVRVNLRTVRRPQVTKRSAAKSVERAR
jgi:hypothetical protein